MAGSCQGRPARSWRTAAATGCAALLALATGAELGALPAAAACVLSAVTGASFVYVWRIRRQPAMAAAPPDGVTSLARLQHRSEAQRLLDRLNIATEAAGISSWEIDVASGTLLWIENPIEGLQSAGWTGHSLTTLADRLHPEDRSLFCEQLHYAAAHQRDRISYRYRAYDDDGRLRHIQVHARLLSDEAGRVARALGVSWDITREITAAERLQRQAQQLREAERRLERASLSSSEGHWEADLVNKRMWFSSSYHALLGYENGELPRDSEEFRQLVHPDDYMNGCMALQKHLEEGTPFIIDQRLKTRSGQYRWFRQRGAAERDAQGVAIVVSGSLQDIHEHKLAEDALQLAQRRLERAIHGTQDGLWELEADADATGAGAWCSPRVAELLGYRPDEFPSDTNFLRTCLHPDDAAVVAQATRAHFELGQPYDVEIRLRTKTGRYLWYRARATAERDATGRPLRLSGSLQDVTEARAAREELLRATQAAEAASRAKSEFLANVSHEIRTPMNGIIGMVGLLLDTRLDRTQRDFAETIRGSADSLLAVINDLLDFSKIEAGKLDIEHIELDLRGSVEDVGGMMAFQAAAKGLELIVHVHKDVPDRVIGDPQRIRQCLVNLVGNAVKFTRTGEVVIEVRIDGRRDGKVLTHFEVRDTGIGIAPEKLDQLFQPFVQADSSTTRHYGGTGLGLSIVRRLVEIMGGRVGVASELGSGSTFWFELPLAPAEGASIRPAPAQCATASARRVLVVDDSATSRRVLGRQLADAGYEVELAGNAAEAIVQMERAIEAHRPFEVVVADYQMPGMDGASLGVRINADERLAQARVVLLTSLDRQGDVQRFASLGFAGYLTKPVRARELLGCMERVLARTSSEWHLQTQPMVTRGTLLGSEPARRYRGHVLLVEDNPVNQKVAVRFLERLGCTVRVADNGAEGVKAYRERSYDLVLMDLQMPVMDGLTATRAIRRLEAGGRATPIVALTANAMTGQLENCLAAGMDGFLTKPLQISRLHEVLDRYGLAQDPLAPDTTPLEGPVPVDLGRLNGLTEGDADFTRELAATFIESSAQVLREIDAALDALDRGALSRAGHKLKGASANVYAEPLRALAEALESQAPAVDQPRLKQLVQDIHREFARAAAFLRTVPRTTARAG